MVDTALGKEDHLKKDLELARQAISDLRLPPEIDRIDVLLDTDASGEAAVRFLVFVKKTIKSDKDVIKRLTDFARDVQTRAFEKGISVFPYASLEEAA